MHISIFYEIQKNVLHFVVRRRLSLQEDKYDYVNRILCGRCMLYVYHGLFAIHPLKLDNIK